MSREGSREVGWVGAVSCRYCGEEEDLFSLGGITGIVSVVSGYPAETDQRGRYYS